MIHVTDVIKGCFVKLQLPGKKLSQSNLSERSHSSQIELQGLG